MSSTSTDADRETEITLYNPSSAEAEELDPGSLDQDVIDIEIDRSLAERLLEVSQHLGLNPTIVASRAIDLVCEEIGTLDEDWRDDEDEFGTVTLIQRYQARVDLLQALKEESDEITEPEPDRAREHAPSAKTDSGSESDEEEEELWDAVDEIKNVLDEVDEAVDSTEDGTDTSDEGLQVKEDESPPTEELTPDDTSLETNQPGQEAEGADSSDTSSRWSTVARIMDVFSDSEESGNSNQPRSQPEGTAEESTDDSESTVPTDELTVEDQDDGTSKREPVEPHADASIELKEEESPPTAEFTVDETMLQEGTLEQKVSDQQIDSDDAARSKDWDAVESIIEQGEQARG